MSKGSNGHAPRIVQPGQLHVEHESHPGELATPVQFQTQTPGGMTIHTMGGFSRREYAALQIIGPLMLASGEQGELTAVARAAWAMAGDVLAEFAGLARAEAETLAAVANGEARKIEGV